MKAAVFKSYGDPAVLEIVETEKPKPADDEVLIKVMASSVNPAEWYALTGLFIARLRSGLFRPKDNRLGVDYSGVVEAVGKNVTHVRPGDAVFGARSGAFAEYVCVKNIVIPKPANISFEQAGSVATAAITALQGLRDHGKLKAGEKVLIMGASGGVGTFAVQIAKALGAEVTAVCSPGNVELVRSLGADYVIDYTKEDVTRNEKRYDLLLHVAGNRTWRDYARILTQDGRFILVGAPKGNRAIGPLGHLLKLRLGAMRAQQKVTFFIATFKREDFLFLKEMMECGQMMPIVERVYPLEQISEAMRYLGNGHAKGKIVVKMN